MVHTVVFTDVDKELLDIRKDEIESTGKSDIYPFNEISKSFEDGMTAIRYAFAKATSTRTKGYKKMYEIGGSMDALEITVKDYLSKTDD